MTNDADSQIAKYLTRLCGQSVNVGEAIALTSGQLARLYGWAEGNGLLLTHDQASNGLITIRRADAQGTNLSSSSRVASTAAPSSPVALSVGIDLQSIAEIVPVGNDLKSDPEALGIFSTKEISYAESRPSPRETLAGLFAAKEAIRKADARFAETPLPEIEVLPDLDGKPHFAGFALSISHSGDYATAVALRQSMPPAPTSHAVAVAPPPNALGRGDAQNRKSGRRGWRLLKAAVKAVLFVGGLFFLWAGLKKIAGLLG